MVASPSYSQQRTFRASSIDIEQDGRLDSLEARMKAVEASVATQGNTSPVAASDPVPNAEPVVVVAPVVQPPPASVRQPSVQRVSGRYTTEELRAMIRQKRPGGWRGPVYADVSPRSLAKQHLVDPKHGFTWDQVNGLTQDEALILHDLAPTHGNQIFPTRGNRYSNGLPAPSASQFDDDMIRNVWGTPYVPSQQAQSGCANGQCANPQSSAVRGGFFRRGFFR